MQEKPRKTESSKAEVHQSFIENQNSCPLCSTKLQIEVVVDDQKTTLKEQAKCPSCDLVARVKDHNLH